MYLKAILKSISIFSIAGGYHMTAFFQEYPLLTFRTQIMYKNTYFCSSNKENVFHSFSARSLHSQTLHFLRQQGRIKKLNYQCKVQHVISKSLGPYQGFLPIKNIKKSSQREFDLKYWSYRVIFINATYTVTSLTTLLTGKSVFANTRLVVILFMQSFFT